MEGVGARLGRSSTRYGPATVFNGPVRRWKKRWVYVSPSNHNSNNNKNHAYINTNGTSIGTISSSNGNNGSHLLLFKWTPLAQTNNNNHSDDGSANHSNGDKSSVKDDDAAPHESPRRKFKYIPTSVWWRERSQTSLQVDLIEKQKQEALEKEAAEMVDDEAKLSDADPMAGETLPKIDGFDEKPDINDMPIEESQDDEQGVRQDLNESTLDLSLGLKSLDGDSDSKPDKSRDGQLGRVNSSSGGT